MLIAELIRRLRVGLVSVNTSRSTVFSTFEPKHFYHDMVAEALNLWPSV